MGLPGIEHRQYHVDFLTEHTLYSGILEPVGQLPIFLNDAERRTFVLKETTVTSLDPAASLDCFQADEIYVRRDDVLAISITEALSRGTMPLLQHFNTLRVFLPRFVVQARFHRGQDTRIGDIFDLMGYWAPASEARVHPLSPLRHGVLHEAHHLMVNKRWVRAYQVVKEPAAAG